MNPFAYPSVAERYAKGRPEFHLLIASKIRAKLRIDGLLPRALDVACGTGMSTRALLSLARRVDGIDSSAAMLSQATATPGVAFHLASAEDLPFPDETFDIATVSSAFHWFDRCRFLGEVARVLRGKGHLVIYENAFPGHMRDNLEYHSWQQSFYAKFPRTPRDSSAFADKAARDCGFEFIAREEYGNEIALSPSELALFLSTQTNAIEAIERGSWSAEEFMARVESQVTAFFEDSTATFKFAGFVWYLQKAG